MVSKIRASFIELFKRHTPLISKENVYNNGANNLYPNEIERVINNSPTAKRALGMMKKFISGAGITTPDEIVNKKKGYRITGLISLIAEDLTRHGGVFLWVGYGFKDGKIKPVEWDVLDYSMCRISKEDDEGNEGNIIYKDYETKRLGNKGKQTIFFPFTSNEGVLLKQIETAGGETLEDSVRMFPGNVYFLNPSNYTYPLSYFDAVYNDCDTEYRIGLYINSMSRLGFLGKTLVITQGMDEEKAEDVKRDIADWLGAENAQGVYHMDVEHIESLDNVIRIEQLESQFDDDQFENTKASVRRNILGAANNIPESLVYASEGALFGSSGEAYAQMKEFYNEQTRGERIIVQNTLLAVGIQTEIMPLI